MCIYIYIYIYIQIYIYVYTYVHTNTTWYSIVTYYNIRIDDDRDVVDRDGGLRDVRRYDHLGGTSSIGSIIVNNSITIIIIIIIIMIIISLMYVCIYIYI